MGNRWLFDTDGISQLLLGAEMGNGLLWSHARNYTCMNTAVNRPANIVSGEDMPMTIGARIKERRVALGLNQEELAKKVGIAQGTLSNLETGKTEAPSGPTLAELCKVLKTTSRWIMEGKGDPAVPAFNTEDEQTVLELLAAMTPEQRQAFVRIGQALIGTAPQPPDPQQPKLHIS